MEIIIQRIIYFALIISQITNCTIVHVCPFSTPTIHYVTSCPQNEREWKKAAKQKNCEIIALHQNCTESKNFQFHCLMNQGLNTTLEICAPILYLPGVCAYYNTSFKEIQENYEAGFECSTFPEAERCPSRYPSSEIFKYQRCFVRKNIEQTTIMSITESTDETDKVAGIGVNVYIGAATILVVTLLLLFLTVSGLRAFLRRKRNSLPAQIHADENTNNVDGPGEAITTYL